MSKVSEQEYRKTWRVQRDLDARGLRFGVQPRLGPSPARRPLGDPGENGPAARETPDRPLPPSDEAASEQGLMRLRPRLASGSGFLHDETSARAVCAWPYLLESMSRSRALSPYNLVL